MRAWEPDPVVGSPLRRSVTTGPQTWRNPEVLGVVETTVVSYVSAGMG